MAIRKRIWIYPDAAPTLTPHLTSGGNNVTILPVSDYLFTIAQVSIPTGNEYVYEDMSSITDYVIQAGDHLEYDIWWQSSSDNISVAMDLTVSDGNNLRDSGALDQNGLSSHPDTNLSSYAFRNWYRRRIPITTFTGGSSIGKTLQFYDLVCEKNDSGTVSAYIKNIAITDGNGVGEDSIDTNTFSSFF